MADEPKSSRKRSVRKSSDNSEVKSVPVPLFQAAPTTTKSATDRSEVARAEVTRSGDDSDKSNFRRRRRRGVRGKKRGRTEIAENLENTEESSEDTNDSAISDSSTGSTHRRRRRRPGRLWHCPWCGENLRHHYHPCLLQLVF